MLDQVLNPSSRQKQQETPYHQNCLPIKDLDATPSVYTVTTGLHTSRQGGHRRREVCLLSCRIVPVIDKNVQTSHFVYSSLKMWLSEHMPLCVGQQRIDRTVHLSMVIYSVVLSKDKRGNTILNNWHSQIFSLERTVSTILSQQIHGSIPARTGSLLQKLYEMELWFGSQRFQQF